MDEIDREFRKYRERVHMFFVIFGVLTFVPAWLVTDYYGQPSIGPFTLLNLIQSVITLLIAGFEAYTYWEGIKLGSLEGRDTDTFGFSDKFRIYTDWLQRHQWNALKWGLKREIKYNPRRLSLLTEQPTVGIGAWMVTVENPVYAPR